MINPHLEYGMCMYMPRASGEIADVHIFGLQMLHRQSI